MKNWSNLVTRQRLDAVAGAIQRLCLLVVIVVVIIVIAVVGVIAALVILRYYSDRDDEPRSRRKAPPAKARTAPRQQPRQPSRQTTKQGFVRAEDPEWDDLSDLDLSYYLDDEDDL